jgi:hypothetical protein
VGVELRGQVNLALGHDATDLEEAILRVLVASPVRAVGNMSSPYSSSLILPPVR